ncbi:MAG: restriction endonuclease subunit S, partial [Anaerolineae bacterium]
ELEAVDVARANLSLSDIRSMTIPLPPLAEQQRIADEVERRLSVVQELEAAVEASLKRAERLRQAILKCAFEGKLAPQGPADEPAGVLLERIRAERVDGKASKKKGEQLRLGGM